MRAKLASIISRVPANRFRVSLYRMLFGYRIENSRIGRRTTILVNSFTITNARIGNHCRFCGPMEVAICDGAKIGGGNRFTCGEWTTRQEFEHANYKRRLQIGRNTLITSGHHFDVAGSFIIGDNSWIAGYGSQFWTHGAGVDDRDIEIGNDCYIGSAVRFCPGSSIGNNVLVGIGSVVSKKIEADNAVIAGVPAKIVKADYDWNSGRYKNKYNWF